MKFLKENIGKGRRVWDPGNMMYTCWGIRVPAWLFECFMTVHAFIQKSFSPLRPSVNPPQRLEVVSGERKIIFCVDLPLLGRLGELHPL